MASQAWVRRPGSDTYELGEPPEHTAQHREDERDAPAGSPGPRAPRQIAQPVRAAGSRATGTARQTASETLGLVQGKTPTTLAGFVLGMIGYAVAINLVHGGPAQVKGWFGAKFLNKPYLPASTSSSSPATALSVAASGAPSGAGLATITPIGVMAPSSAA